MHHLLQAEKLIDMSWDESTEVANVNWNQLMKNMAKMSANLQNMTANPIPGVDLREAEARFSEVAATYGNMETFQ